MGGERERGTRGNNGRYGKAVTKLRPISRNRRWPRPKRRTWRFRYVEWRDFKTGELLARELYDYRRGGSETENLVAEANYARHVERLSRLLPLGFATLRKAEGY